MGGSQIGELCRETAISGAAAGAIFETLMEEGLQNVEMMIESLDTEMMIEVLSQALEAFQASWQMMRLAQQGQSLAEDGGILLWGSKL